MKNIVYLSALLLIFSITMTQAQPVNKLVNDVVMPGPNIASMGKFIDNPVDYSSGVPSINIPIHTLEYGPLQVPISLNYHAGGVKLGEPASWVGLNWNLSAGGAVTRTVVGLPDDLNGGYYLSGTSMVNNLSGDCGGAYCSLDLTDTEPDIFNAVYPEGSLKFYFTTGQK
jgi:hypothetical protein